MASNPVLIIGHRNPDADSICAAIAYADFKNRFSDRPHLSCRCGNSNARIEAILNRFGQKLPDFIGDVTPRVKDIMVREVVSVEPEATCHEALSLIDRHDVRVLPVVGADKKVEGMVSVFQLGEYFIPKLREPKEMRRVHTSVANIVRALDAEVLCSQDEEMVDDYYVRVGAMDVRSFGKFSEIEDVDPSKSIIIVGDRWDIQQRSIQYGVRLLVITGDLKVEPEILADAQKKGVSLVISRYDSATTAWIIRSASSISRLISSEVVFFHGDESVEEARRRTAGMAQPAFFVVDEAKRLKGIFTRTDLLKPTATDIILVDHNELGQAVPGADQVNIQEIVDHHRLGNLHTSSPILFMNEPVGSTSTIIADFYRRENCEPEASIAGLLMGGIISDTLNLKSPTATLKDDRILTWLESLAGVSRDELADLIFSSGSIILSQSPQEVVRSDFKKYHERSWKFSLSQVEELGYGNFLEHREALLGALEETRQAENLHFSALLVTDINTQNSLLAVKGDKDFIGRIQYPQAYAPDIFDLQGVVSRKKQLVPFITSVLNSLPDPMSYSEESKAKEP
ncbi:MAG: putative manganese-dependent inorganic diphosphatase [Opitutales bacterium]|nr:putative manganese-dependent inorganic diphosphatase [Opitutales bacterium]